MISLGFNFQATVDLVSLNIGGGGVRALLFIIYRFLFLSVYFRVNSIRSITTRVRSKARSWRYFTDSFLVLRESVLRKFNSRELLAKDLITS